MAQTAVPSNPAVKTWSQMGSFEGCDFDLLPVVAEALALSELVEQKRVALFGDLRRGRLLFPARCGIHSVPNTLKLLPPLTHTLTHTLHPLAKSYCTIAPLELCFMYERYLAFEREILISGCLCDCAAQKAAQAAQRGE